MRTGFFYNLVVGKYRRVKYRLFESPPATRASLREMEVVHTTFKNTDCVTDWMQVISLESSPELA